MELFLTEQSRSIVRQATTVLEGPLVVLERCKNKNQPGLSEGLVITKIIPKLMSYYCLTRLTPTLSHQFFNNAGQNTTEAKT